MVKLLLPTAAPSYTEGELRHIRTSRVSSPTQALYCPRHSDQLMMVASTRTVTLEDGVEFPAFTRVSCPECGISAGVDLTVVDSELLA